MAQKQRDIWDLVNRTRQSFINFANREARKALDIAYKPITDALPDLLQIDDSVIEQISEQAFKDLLIELYFVIGVKFARTVFNQLLKAEFSESNYLLEVEKVVELEGAAMVKGMTQSSKNKIKQIIAQQIRLGEPVQQAGINILKRLQTINRARAFSIARTETIRASNIGAIRGAQMTGLNLKKEWISTLDDRTRDEEFNHVVSDGQQVDLNQPFIVSGEALAYPVDFNGSAGNTINCRCAVAFIREG